MDVSFIVVAISFIIFVFCVYVLSIDDFILLRKNVSIEKVFDSVFFAVIAGLLTARIFFVIFQHSTTFLNPLAFFSIFHFPGFSLLGGIVGAGGGLIYYCLRKKYPVGRMVDIFALCLFFALSIGYFSLGILSIIEKHFAFYLFIASVLYILLSFVLLTIFQRAKLKDGSVGIIFLFISSIISLVGSILPNVRNNMLLPENILLIVAALGSLIFLAKQENLLSFVLKKVKR